MEEREGRHWWGQVGVVDESRREGGLCASGCLHQDAKSIRA